MILEGIRIVDLSSGIAGPVAAMLLAEAGADVIKVEPPGGAPDRAAAGFRTWNRSKRSVVLDGAGDARLRQLLAAADVLIHDLTPSHAAAHQLDDASLADLNPALIVCSVLSWPANHPDADRPVDELLAMARLGICDEQRAVRRSGPVYIRFPLGGWDAVWLAATGVLARLLARDATGRGGPAHTSLVQGALVPMGMHWHRAETPTPVLAYGMPKELGGSQSSLFECGDGRWIHLMAPPDGAPLMRQALEAMGTDGVDAANAAVSGVQHQYPNQGANASAFKTRPSHEWLEDFWANDIPAQPALPFGEVLEDEQARRNGYVTEIDDPEAGRITVPGVPFSTTPPSRVRGPAPALGAHTDEVLSAWRPSARTTAVTHERGRRLPLEGLKVLDLGNYLAGPYGPMLLADLGADVVKVEAATGDPMRHVDWAFAGCQRGKRSVALDLKSPDARPALDTLLRWADVVHHNLRRPAARRLGLDYESVQAVNPAVVYCHTSSYGPLGPRADWPGYDQLFQALCGWEVLGAGEGNPPMWHRFGFMDHLCAMASVVAVLLALHHRARTGEGQCVTASLLGAGVLTAGETYLRPDGTPVPVATLDADQTGVTPDRRLVPHDDGWVAVAGEHAEPVRERQRDAFFDDPANIAAGLVARYRHAEWGQLEQPGDFWFFGDLECRHDLAPPALGEHTIEVLKEVGLDPADIDRLLAAGVAKAYGR